MKKMSFHIVLLLISFFFSSCRKDDEYVYPSVKLEFLTAESGNDGFLSYLVTDSGERLEVSEDLSKTQIEANSSVRIVTNYKELDKTGTGIKQAKVYALLKAVSPEPSPASGFADGVKTDPADVLSMWLGRDYLNVTLSIKMQNGKHLFHFVENKVETDQTTGRKTVYLTLYHDAGNDLEAFTRRAYLSVPLSKYTENNTRETIVYFSVNTYDDGVQTYRFESTPTSN